MLDAVIFLSAAGDALAACGTATCFDKPAALENALPHLQQLQCLSAANEVLILVSHVTWGLCVTHSTFSLRTTGKSLTLCIKHLPFPYAMQGKKTGSSCSVSPIVPVLHSGNARYHPCEHRRSCFLSVKAEASPTKISGVIHQQTVRTREYSC